MNAGVLVTGTEVVDGSITDENGPWLSIQLDRLGIRTESIVSCRDDKQTIIESLSFLESTGCDLVVTSGGLGPTADDVTAQAVSEFCETELRYDEDLKNRIVEKVRPFVKKANLDLDALERAADKQAMIPHEAEIVAPAGTAPGFTLKRGSCTVLVLPGPPRELKTMWKDALKLPSVLEVVKYGERRKMRMLRIFGITESEFSETQRQLEKRLDLSDLEITTCMRQSELEVVIHCYPDHQQVTEDFIAGVEKRHSRELFSQDGSTVDDQLGVLLKGHRLAIAESCTAGMISARVADVAGASAYLVGGVVAYSNEAKIDLLSIDPKMIEDHGAVSAQVAEAMAEGALSIFGADIAISVTGIAGPDGGTPAKPVGTVFFAIARINEAPVSRHLELPGDRNDVRNRATIIGVHLLRRSLSEV